LRYLTYLFVQGVRELKFYKLQKKRIECMAYYTELIHFINGNRHYFDFYYMLSQYDLAKLTECSDNQNVWKPLSSTQLNISANFG